MDQATAIIKANRYITRLSQYYDIEKVYLFGSFAKNNFHKDSDIDLAVIVNSITGIFDIQIDLLKNRTDDELIIEPHPFKSEDFNSNHPMFDEIQNYGIELEFPVSNNR